jgi:hypothetical protein
MPSSRFRQLIDKDIDGTITDVERDELEATVRERTRQMYDQCPACGGAFALDLVVRDKVQCPQCDTLLEHYSSDVPGHDIAEIDRSLEPASRLGIFSVGYAVPGTVPCLYCGIYYPKNYTCCPGLFRAALQLHREGTESQRQLALLFIDSHAATLLNSLRGRFVESLDQRTRENLARLATELKCGDALQRALDETSTERAN